MESILEWGANVVLWFQQFSPALDLPFSALTFLGNEEFFLLLLPFLYWCVDRRTGVRLVVLFLFSAYLNAAAKVLADQPRPFEYDPRVQMIREAEGGGFPSGHTQGSVVAWGYLGTQLRRKWFWIVVGLLVVLVPLSRIYLGVHFPHDLLGGYAIGGVLLGLYLWLEPKAELWLTSQGWAWQAAMAVAIPLGLVLLFPMEDGITTGATLLGMGSGFVLERRWVRFELSRSWWKRAVGFVVGVAVLMGLWLGLRIAFSGLEPALVLRFLRYGLTGLWGGLGAPWLFVRVGLAERAG